MERPDHQTRVAQKAVLFRDDGSILALRRSQTAPSRPLHWDLPGGDLDAGEDARAGMLREIQEETGLSIQDLSVLDVISGYNDRNELWITIGYTARAVTHDVVLSFEHDDFQWITPDAFQQREASPRNKQFVEAFGSLRKKRCSSVITYQDFECIDVRVGTIVAAEDFPEARKPAYKLTIDFGPEIGTKRSSVQITAHDTRAELIGKQVVAVVNFPPKQIGPVISEVLTLGLPDANGAVVLLAPTSSVPNGGRMF